MKEVSKMSYVPIQELLEKTGSLYKLVVMAAHRASDINAGAPRMIEADHEKVTSVALEEIAQDKIRLTRSVKGK
ncbi:MAG: DNA-directed RNA polymerase subunit omega [Candidatus Omnitrophota bacterium]